MNYFTLFNIPKIFNIDKTLLSKNFYKLQLQFHPDLFINASIDTKKIVLQKSIQINQGYKILTNFLSRAVYFLSLQGIHIKQETNLLKNHVLLKKYFSLYEELATLKKNHCSEKLFKQFSNKITNEIKHNQKKIEIEFERKNFNNAIYIVEKLLFLEKIKKNVEKEQNMFTSDRK